jgi:hypothetical protein
LGRRAARVAARALAEKEVAAVVLGGRPEQRREAAGQCLAARTTRESAQSTADVEEVDAPTSPT